MLIFFLCFILLYALVMGELLTKWKIEGKKISDDKPPVSVIIPFRNEALNLSYTLKYFKELEAEEIIFCNDHSEDDSCKLIQDYIDKFNLSHWRLINSTGIGKKAAITTAVTMSSHELIFTTDADCLVTGRGIDLLKNYFEDPEIQMVCGPVTVTSGNSFLEKYQVAEWASIALVTNYFFKIRKPLMCSAANMAYRKAAFTGVEGYRYNAKISSGDDEYLLKKIAAKYGPSSIRYTNQPDALVATIPTADLGLYLTQRARWASKWKAHKGLTHAMTAISFSILAMIQLGSLLLLGSRLENYLTFCVFWLIKIGVDFMILGYVIKTFGRKVSFMRMIGVSVFHPLSVIVIGIFSIFVKNTWKGRVIITKA